MQQNLHHHKTRFPPGFELITLREGKDAHQTACDNAVQKGAGTIYVTKRFDIAEFALILEPQEPLFLARKAFYLGMNALADALAVAAPPEKPVTLTFPDALLLDGGLIGGGRLAWSQTPEEAIPDWLVFSGMVRLSIVGVKELGEAALATSLETEGGEELDSLEFIAAFARHFMNGVHLYAQEGFKGAAQIYLARLAKSEARRGIDGNGDLLIAGQATQAFLPALEPLRWLDKTTGAPKL
jgi:Biotin/lipoate A/B protein ligase family